MAFNSKCFLMTLCALLCLSLYVLTPEAAVKAASKIDTREGGSLEIHYRADMDGQEPLVGAEFVCIKMADWSEGTALIGKLTAKDKNGHGIVSDKKVDAVNITQMDISDILKEALEIVGKKSDSDELTCVSGKTDDKGDLFFEDLPPGLYVGGETGNLKGYERSSAFFFTLPYQLSDADRNLSYRMVLYPKTKKTVYPQKPTDVQPKRDTASGTARSVTVVKTSDASSIGPEVALMLGSVGVLTGVLIIGKHRKEKENSK